MCSKEFLSVKSIILAHLFYFSKIQKYDLLHFKLMELLLLFYSSMWGILFWCNYERAAFPNSVIVLKSTNMKMPLSKSDIFQLALLIFL